VIDAQARVAFDDADGLIRLCTTLMAP